MLGEKFDKELCEIENLINSFKDQRSRKKLNSFIRH